MLEARFRRTVPIPAAGVERWLRPTADVVDRPCFVARVADSPKENPLMPPALRLSEDILSNAATLALPPLPRMIFVVHGAVTIAERTLGDGEAWHGESAVTLAAGGGGAACWRFELTAGAMEHAAAPGVTS